MFKMPKNLIRCCYLTSKWLALGAFLTIILLNCANLFSRWVFSSPFAWVLEASLILFVYSVMLIVPVLYHDKGFIRMHLVEELVGQHASRYINLLADSLVLIFVAYLLYQGLSLSLGQFHILSRGIGIPRFFVTIPLALGAFLSLPIGIDILLLHVTVLRGKREQSDM